MLKRSEGWSGMVSPFRDYWVSAFCIQETLYKLLASIVVTHLVKLVMCELVADDASMVPEAIQVC